MNFVQIATSVVMLIAPYLAKLTEAAAQKTGENIADKTAELYKAIVNKFSRDKDEYAQKTLQRFKEKPSTESRQRALIDILVEKAETDSEFAEELNKGLQSTTQGKDVSQFLTQVYGGKVKNIVSIHKSENITFK